MAEGEGTGTAGPEGSDAEQDGAPTASPRLLLNTHYIKDLSFENPNAPQVYVELPKAPSIDVSVDVDVNHLQDRLFEVVLTMRVKASLEEMTVFLVGDPEMDGKMDFAGFMRAYTKFFGTEEQPNKPARSAVQIAGLAGGPYMLVEVEAVIARP